MVVLTARRLEAVNSKANGGTHFSANGESGFPLFLSVYHKGVTL